MSKRRLLFSVTIKDCDVQTFTVGGCGGSGKDTSNTGVRVVHVPSGASGRATETRSQLKNKQTAFKRMAQSEEFQRWARLRAAEAQASKSVDALVDEAMQPENIRVEGQTAKGWQII